MFNGIFQSLYTTTVTTLSFLICSLCAIALGILHSTIYHYFFKASETLASSLALLPFLVQIVILLVNGNLGTGLSVVGAFSLVRFRSAPGSSRDIMAIFLSMTIGLCCGMGYFVLAILVTVITCLFIIILRKSVKEPTCRDIRVVIGENVNYSALFKDLFDKYTSQAKLVRVKTTNMGSLYKLYYQVVLKDDKDEKELLDQMRCRNGNLEISCGISADEKEESI